MSNEQPKIPKLTTREQLAVLLKPEQILKTVASGFPIAATATSLMDAIEGEVLNRRVSQLESESEQAKQQLEAIQKQTIRPAANNPPPVPEWSMSASIAHRHTVDIVYEFDRTKTYIPFAHGTLLDGQTVVTAVEVAGLLSGIRKQQPGRAYIVKGYGWYDFTEDFVDSHHNSSGLVSYRIGARVNEKWEYACEIMASHKLGEPSNPLVVEPVKFAHAYIGTELGFTAVGDHDENASRISDELQFTKTVVSHFYAHNHDHFHSVITSPIANRFVFIGSGLFDAWGNLVAVNSESVSYPHDAGRRVIGRSLYGLPRAMEELFPKKTAAVTSLSP
jgi:hypothetical protein